MATLKKKPDQNIVIVPERQASEPLITTRLAETLKQLVHDDTTVNKGAGTHQNKAVNRYWIALSGGLDSQVLLHGMASLRERYPDISLHVIHVDHQLQAESGEWTLLCEKTCQRLGIDFHCITVEVNPETGESLEAVARDKRYAAFASRMENGDCLLTAHHQDDQAETLLLQLMRGAGPHGLAAMPATTAFASGMHCRPFLEISREALEGYARDHKLTWVDDKSNTDTRFDRNFMRHEIIPLLKKRWPSLSRTVSRSAQLNAEAASLVDRVAGSALETHHGSRKDTLSVREIRQTLSIHGDSECRNLLRYWLQQLNLPLPGFSHLHDIIKTVVMAKDDAAPLLKWKGVEVRRYGDDLFAGRPLQPHDSSSCLQWDMSGELLLPTGMMLRAEPVSGAGLAQDKFRDAMVTVKFRQGGERCKPAGHTHTQPLKKLMQAWKIPPWERNRIPLVYFDNDLVAVAGHAILQGWQANAGEAGFHMVSVTGKA